MIDNRIIVGIGNESRCNKSVNSPVVHFSILAQCDFLISVFVRFWMKSLSLDNRDRFSLTFPYPLTTSYIAKIGYLIESLKISDCFPNFFHRNVIFN